MAMKNCAQCGMENAETSKFCRKCGNPMDTAPVSAPIETPAAGPTCPSCGASNGATSKFCKVCGSPLAGDRKVGKHEAPKAPSKQAAGAGAAGAAGIAGVAQAAPTRAGAPGNAGAKGVNVDLNKSMEDAKKRMGNILGTDVEGQMAGRVAVDLRGVKAASREETVRAFEYFGINLNLPVASQANSFDTEILAMSNAIVTGGVADDSVHVMYSADEDKRRIERPVVADSDGVYASQFASTWAITPEMIEGKNLGASARKESMERMRHRVEMGEMSTNEAAAQIEANRNAAMR